MKHFHLFLVFSLSIGLLSFSGCDKGKVYPYRWFYISRNLRKDSHVDDIREIVKTASEHGLNGMYFSSGFDMLDLKGDDYFRRLKAVKSICDKYGVEIIPRCLDVGYNGGLLAHNRNLAAGIPVKNALFVAKKGEARLKADPPVSVANGDFEDYKENQVAYFDFGEMAGKVVFVDT